MKIDFPSGLNAYRKASAASEKVHPTGSPKEKTDVAAFSRGSTQVGDKSMVGFKASLQSSLVSSADPARIAALRQSVRDGSYHVETDKLVDAILDINV